MSKDDQSQAELPEEPPVKKMQIVAFKNFGDHLDDIRLQVKNVKKVDSGYVVNLREPEDQQ